MKEFLQDRDEMLRTLDPVKIEAYMVKYKIQRPANDLVLMAGLHKARLALTSFTEEEKNESILWLTANGFSLSPFWDS